MMRRITLLLAVTTLMNGMLIGNNNPVVPTVEESAFVGPTMTTEISGAVQLYSVLKEEIELINTEAIPGMDNKNNIDWHLAYNRDYFIGFSADKVEAITPSNFKRIAKKYFASTPELVGSIGKKGFRYKNLPTIILYYNNQVTQGKSITKKDKLVVKQIRK